ncbi:complement receptor type 2 [Lingula anatina]|uniref:Complement receptor type 2 n=1 Tax=Lingula anatina TaxID=7574 RepID=A0A1S3IQH1_LINAN|nr:complement receptor type 2 [Lingula anatina]|eukprot:XP_013400318.1 complement receptor type 2 [Lingula anatina]
MVGTVAIVTCVQGFLFPDFTLEKTLTCGASRQWEPPAVDCQRYCPPIAADHTIPRVNYTDPGVRVSFQCEIYHTFPNVSLRHDITCGYDGTWNDTVPACAEITNCPVLPNITNAVPVSDNTSVGVTVQYQCLNNMTFADDRPTRSTSCGRDGKWHPKLVVGCSGESFRFVPRSRKHAIDPVEAPGAPAIGSLGIIFVVTLLVGIVLLDTTTLFKQLRLMKRNLSRFLIKKR